MAAVSRSAGRSPAPAYPTLSQAGFGATHNTTAFRPHGRGTARTNPRPAGATAWPPAGYVPFEIMPTSTRWSYSAPEVDFSSATVTMTRNGAAISTAVVARNGVYGDPALVWEVPASGVAPEAGKPDVYQVTLSGIPGAPVSYRVTVFRAGVAKAESVDIAGSPVPGNTLTATAGGLTPTKPANDAFVSYAWYRNGVKVGEESTYSPTSEDVGGVLVARATVSTLFNNWASGTTDSAPLTVRPGTLDPAYYIVGSPQVGQELLVDGWSGTPVDAEYQWLRDGQPMVPNVTGSAYTLTAQDAGKLISARVTVSAPGFSPATLTTDPVGPVTDSNPGPPPASTKKFTTTPAPKISGTAKVGRKLTAKPGTWKPGGVAFAYQWYRDGTAIDGATASTYPLRAADKGKKLTVKVTGTKAGFKTVTKTSKATKKVAAGTLTTVKPKIRGTAKVDQTLTVTTGTWKPAEVSLTYQWYRSGKKIAGATGPSYLVTGKDQKKKLTVKVTGRAPGYTTKSQTSKATKKVS